MAAEARDTTRGAQRRTPPSTGTPQDPGPRALGMRPPRHGRRSQLLAGGVVPTKRRARRPPPPVPAAAVTVGGVLAIVAAAALLSLPPTAVGVRAAWWLLLRFRVPAPAVALFVGGGPSAAAASGDVTNLTGFLVRPLGVVGGAVICGGWTPPAVSARIMRVRSGDPAVDEQMDMCTDAAARCIEVEGTQAACDACVAECSDAADAVLASSVLSGDEKADLLTLAREQSDRCEEDM